MGYQRSFVRIFISAPNLTCKAEIRHLTAADTADMDFTRAGLKGSPTKVKKTFVPQRNKEVVMIKAVSAQEQASVLYEALDRANVI